MALRYPAPCTSSYHSASFTSISFRSFLMHFTPYSLRPHPQGMSGQPSERHRRRHPLTWVVCKVLTTPSFASGSSQQQIPHHTHYRFLSSIIVRHSNLYLLAIPGDLDTPVMVSVVVMFFLRVTQRSAPFISSDIVHTCCTFLLVWSDKFFTKRTAFLRVLCAMET